MCKYVNTTYDAKEKSLRGGGDKKGERERERCRYNGIMQRERELQVVNMHHAHVIRVR